MTSGRKLGPAWIRLIAVVDDLYPLPSGSKASASTSASSSKPSLPLVKDVETKSGEDKK